MNRRVAAGSPAGSDLQIGRMKRVADVNLAAGRLDLCVAAQAKIRIAVDKHFLIDRTMRAMTDDAAFAHRRMREDERSGLVAMTLRTTFILPRHGQSARRLENVVTVRVVALHTIHMSLDDGMVMRQIKFRVDVEVALKTGRRVFARVDDKIGAAGLNVFAARPMTGFAARLANHRCIIRMNPRVRAGGKYSDNGLVAIRAGLVADKMRTGNFQGCH